LAKNKAKEGQGVDIKPGNLGSPISSQSRQVRQSAALIPLDMSYRLFGAEAIIPVSSVEQGRWAYRSPKFQSGKKIMPPSLRREHQRSRKRIVFSLK